VALKSDGISLVAPAGVRPPDARYDYADRVEELRAAVEKAKLGRSFPSFT